MSITKTTSAIYTKIFGRQIIPLLLSEGLSRIVVARPELNKTFLPEGVQASNRKMRGKRVAVGARYGRDISARWPEDGLQTHRFLNLTFVVSGRIDYPCGKYALHCGAGNWILLPPETPGNDGSHSFVAQDRHEKDVCDTLLISQRGRGVHLWMRHSQGSKYQLFPGQNIFIPSGEGANFLTVINEEIAAQRTHWPEVCLSSLQALCFVLKRESQIGRFLSISGGQREEVAKKDDYDPIAQAQNYIKAHLNEHLTMERVARSVHLSRAQFARMFRDQTQQTFTSWTNTQRLEEAQNFLRDTEWHIPSISSFVGFRSPSYFHTLFKENIGMTPLEFRVNARDADSHENENRDDRAED